MGHQAKATTVLENAVKRTNATVKKKAGRAKHDVFKAWTVARLLEEYRDPRAILLEIAGKDTKALAAEMQCSLQDALAERRLCAQAVIPYICQKLPTQVDVRSTRAINLNIVDDRQYQELVAVAQTEDANNDGSFSMQMITAQPTEAQTTDQQTDPDSGKIEPTDTHSDEPPTSLPPVSRFWNSLNRTTPIEPKPAEQGDKRGVSPSAAAAPSRAAEESWQKDEQHGGTWAPDRRK